MVKGEESGIAVRRRGLTERTNKTGSILVGLLTLLCVGFVPFGPVWAQETSTEGKSAEGTPASASKSEDVEAGKKLYEKWCVNCHGAEGGGDGAAADFLRPRPRNFKNGLFKIRSTLGGKLPTDDDLVHVISKGMPGTSMPAWETLLKEPEQRQIISYIKTFSRRFARAKEAPELVKIGAKVASSAESVARGKELFKKIECFKCHGTAGRADGPSAPELTDDWSYPIRPADLTKPWNFRGGHTPEDLYRRLQGGLAGTPMPSFSDSLNNEQTWDLINYVMSLGPDPSGARPPLKVVLRARRVEGTIPTAPGDPFWQKQEVFRYPLVGQVIEDPRLFTPSVDEVQVQAVYSADRLTLRLVWDDPTHSMPDADKGTYEDAVAVQFPIETPTGPKRPYFLMGDAELGVQLLRWSNAGGASGTATELNGRGLAHVVAQPASSQETAATGEYVDGEYRVVMTRLLKTSDPTRDIQLDPGRFIPVGFFVWDGSNGETAGRMAMSHWYYFLMEPPLPTTVYIYPAVGVVVAAGLQWWMIRRLRKR